MRIPNATVQSVPVLTDPHDIRDELDRIESDTPDATTIEALKYAAGAAGDYKTVQYCDMLLHGEHYADQGDDNTIATASETQIAKAKQAIVDTLQEADDSDV